jgi:hypothetical protein
MPFYIYYGLGLCGFVMSRIYRYELRLYLHHRFRSQDVTERWEAFRLAIHYYVYFWEEPLHYWMPFSFIVLAPRYSSASGLFY